MADNINKSAVALFFLMTLSMLFILGNIFNGDDKDQIKDEKHIEFINLDSNYKNDYNYYLANSHSYWFPLDKPSYFKLIRPSNKFKKEILRTELEKDLNAPLIGIQKPNFLPIEMITVLSGLLKQEKYPKKVIFSIAYYNFYDSCEIRKELKNNFMKDKELFTEFLEFLKENNFDNLYTYYTDILKTKENSEDESSSLFDAYERKFQEFLQNNFSSVNWLLNNLKEQSLYIYYSIRDFILQELIGINLGKTKKHTNVKSMNLNVESIAAMLKFCENKNIDAIGYFAPIKRSSTAPYYVSELETWIIDMKLLFGSYDKSTLIDTSDLFKDKKYWGYYDTRPDWTHIKPQGHYELANILKEYIDEIQ